MSRLWTAIVLLTLTLSTPAQSENPIVAKVGDREIRADDLLTATSAMIARGASREGIKRAALDGLVLRNLMVVEAEARGMEQSDQRQRMWVRIDNELLLKALDARLIEEIEVTEEEVARALEFASFEMTLWEIDVEDADLAEKVTAELRAGADFQEMARAVSADTRSQLSGGRIDFPINGLATYEGPLVPLAEAEPGDIVGPIGVRQHFAIFKLEERRPVERLAWTDEQLRHRLVTMKEDAARLVFLEEKKREFNYVFNPEPAQRIATAVREAMIRHQARIDSIAATGAVVPGGAALIELPMAGGGKDQWGIEDHWRDQWVYKHDKGGRQVSLYVDRMARVPVDFVALNTHASRIEEFCEEFFRQDVYPEEAKLRGIDEEIDWERTRKERYEDFMTDELFKNAILGTINPHIETLREFWETNKSRFPGPEEFTALRVCFEAEEDADGAMLSVQQGTDLAEIARQLEEEGREGVEIVWKDHATRKTWLGGNLQSSPVGYTTRANTPEGTPCVLKLLDRQPGPPDFTATYDDVLEHYRHSQSEAPLQEFLAEVRERHVVEVDEEVLKALELPE